MKGKPAIAAVASVALLVLSCALPCISVPGISVPGVVDPEAEIELVVRRAFEAWAQENGVPYRSQEFYVMVHDDVFATVFVVSEFMQSADVAWEEQLAAVECREVGGAWQCDDQMLFAPVAWVVAQMNDEQRLFFYYHRGVAFLQEGRPWEAAWHLGRVAEIDGDYEDTATALAEARRGVGRVILVSRPDWASDTDLYAANAADMNRQVRLTSEPGDELEAVWSPDGTRIAFLRWEGEQVGLFTVNADGSGQVRVETDPPADMLLAWSPDNQRVAYASEPRNLGADGWYAREAYRIHVVDTRTGRVVTAGETDHDIAEMPPCSWSPDSRYIACALGMMEDMEEGGSGVNIYVTGVAESSQFQLTRDLAALEPVWSPDGEMIAFTSLESYDTFNLHVIDVDGTGRTELTTYGEGGSDVFYYIWSPDSEQIAFHYSHSSADDGAMYVVDRDGSNLVRVVEQREGAHFPDGRGGFLPGLYWSPRGDAIAVFEYSLKADWWGIRITSPDGGPEVGFVYGGWPLTYPCSFTWLP